MYRPETVKEILTKSADKFRDNCAFTFLDGKGAKTEINYSRLKSDVDGLSMSLIHKMKMKGEKAAIVSCNCYEWCVSYLACLSSAVVAVPIDRELSAADAGNIIRLSGAKLVFCDRFSAAKLKHIEDVQLCCFEERDSAYGFYTLIESGRRLFSEGFDCDVSIDSKALAVLLFTSGTTGNPKGVMLSNSNLCSDLYLVRNNIRITEQDRSLSLLPLHHTYETIAFLMILYCGGSIAFCGGVRYLGKSFQIFSPTVFVTVPLVLEKLHGKIISDIESRGLKQKFRFASLMSSAVSDEKKKKLFADIHSFFGSRLCKIVVGAAALNPAVAADFELFGFQIIIGYGLTECSPIVICNSTDDRTADTVGRPLAETQVMLRKTDEKGVGEILVRGPMVMMGYYNNEKATKEVFSNGWFCTGDLAFRDKNGRFRITGRCKNVIVTRNGKNIYPEEIEEKLCATQFVRECVVSGERGDIVACEILADEDAVRKKLKKNVVSDEDIKSVINETVRSVNRHLPSYKRIRKVTVRKEEFNKTATHKIKRKY